MSNDVVVTLLDGVLEVVLNRPDRLNALTSTMIGQVADAVSDGQGRSDVGSILLRGEGRAFCSGDDLEDLSGAAGDQAAHRHGMDVLQSVSHSIMTGSKPVVVAVQGWAIGAAFSWVLNGDFVVCGETACAMFPEIRWGVTPTGGATALLPRYVGPARAREAFYLRRRFPAEELLAAGIAYRVVPDGDLLGVARTLAIELAALPSGSFSSMKTLMLEGQGLGEGLGELLASEGRHALQAAFSDQTASSIASFRSHGDH